MTVAEKRKRSPHYRSLFWPMIAIGLGSAWLLYNLGIFTGANLSVIFQIWPLLLIAVGLDFIFGRTSPSRGASIGLAFVGFVLAIMYIGPSIGLGSNVEYTNTTFDVPRDASENLKLNIEAGIDSVRINPLIDSNNLIEGDIWHLGELDVNINDSDGTKTVTVQQKDFTFNFGWNNNEENGSGWAIDVNPTTPLAINFEGGIGETTMDLSAFNLTRVDFNMGVGQLELTLPTPVSSYEVDIEGGIGEVVVDIPDDVEFKVVASTGIGDAELPSGLIQLSGDDSRIGADGTWQTPDFDQAEQTIIIMFDGGIGSLKVR